MLEKGPEKSQEMRTRRLAVEILQATGLIVRSATAKRLARYGSLAQIWLSILPLPQQMIGRQFPTRQEYNSVLCNLQQEIYLKHQFPLLSR